MKSFQPARRLATTSDSNEAPLQQQSWQVGSMPINVRRVKAIQIIEKDSKRGQWFPLAPFTTRVYSRR